MLQSQTFSSACKGAVVKTTIKFKMHMMMMMTWTTCKAQCVDQSTSKAQINIVQVYTISGKNVFSI